MGVYYLVDTYVYIRGNIYVYIINHSPLPNRGSPPMPSNDHPLPYYASEKPLVDDIEEEELDEEDESDEDEDDEGSDYDDEDEE